MIGVFDSGSGGLSVLKAIRGRAPRADIVYFGDFKNVPYGNKSREELDALTTAGIETLLKHGATYIVSACNSVALSTMRSSEACQLSPHQVLEMVGPTVRPFQNTNAHVLVLATKATIESAMYQNEFKAVGVKADGVAVPYLVGLIEGGQDHEAMEAMLNEVLQNSLTEEHTHVVLGCTHFPLVRDVFEKVLQTLQSNVALVDPADMVADAVVTQFAIEGQGTTRILASAESPVFESFLQPLFPQGRPPIEFI